MRQHVPLYYVHSGGTDTHASTQRERIADSGVVLARGVQHHIVAYSSTA